jgi:hypothetical protein
MYPDRGSLMGGDRLEDTLSELPKSFPREVNLTRVLYH